MITLVTDSTAYLTKAEAEKLKIRLVPMHYILAGKSYAESYADENGDFVPQIAAHQEICATAQASVADFVGIFQAIVHQGGRGALPGNFLTTERRLQQCLYCCKGGRR